jgi:hypothetical protein
LDFWVDVNLRNVDQSWLAVAEIGGESEIGLGRSAQEALSAVLSCLGDEVASVLAADPQLCRVTPGNPR